jgi:outer membrane protein assembly factor BamB
VNRRRLLLGGVLAVIAMALAVGAYAYLDDPEPTKKRGSAKQEFVTTEPEVKPPPKEKEDPTPWATYAYDRERTHVSPFRHRPPKSRIWKVDAHDSIEYPPSVGFGKVFLAQQKGLFLALRARSGRVAWRKQTKRCMAAAPTLAKGVVYQSVMDFVPCPQARSGATGYVIAWKAKTGKKLWKWNNAPVESSPLLVKKTLYVGTWDHGIYALNAKNGRVRWRFGADDEVNTAAAYYKGTIYIASDGGTLYALNARTGRLRWKAGNAREFFYATPTIAYGRVYIGSTDGTMYVYGARSGRLLWARPLGSYIYGAAGVYKRRVFVGTYDGFFYALDAATGDVKWRINAPGAVHAAPTIMRGLVYFATCSSCGSAASRAVKHGPDGTYAVRAKNGKRVWSFGAGKYANPVVADAKRVYVTGRAHLFALRPPTKKREARKKKREAERKKRQAERKKRQADRKKRAKK